MSENDNITNLQFGVQFDFAAVLSQAYCSVGPKPGRLNDTKDIILEIKEEDVLGKAASARIAGTLSFLNSQCVGQLLSSPLRPLAKMAHDKKGT